VLIYRFAFGYRTIHVRQVHRRRWRYTICRCDDDDDSGSNRGGGSEYTVGRIWAGEDGGVGWRHARPLCDFDDSKHSGGHPARSPSGVKNNNRQWSGEAKLHLDLLRTCKTVYSEASGIPYTDNIYTFVLVRAFEGFLEQRHRGLSLAQLGLIRNLCIFVQPRGYMMQEWNLFLGGNSNNSSDEQQLSSCVLDGLTGLRRLQLVVGPQSRIVRLRVPLGPWTELWLVYGLLAFTKLGSTLEVSVNVGLCDRNGEVEGDGDDEESVQGYKGMLEGVFRRGRPWEEVEKELAQLRSAYLGEYCQ